MLLEDPGENRLCGEELRHRRCWHLQPACQALSFRSAAQDALERWERKQKGNKGFFLLGFATGSPVLSEGAAATELRGSGALRPCHCRGEVQAEEIPVPILLSQFSVKAQLKINCLQITEQSSHPPASPCA